MAILTSFISHNMRLLRHLSTNRRYGSSRFLWISKKCLRYFQHLDVTQFFEKIDYSYAFSHEIKVVLQDCGVIKKHKSLYQKGLEIFKIKNWVKVQSPKLGSTVLWERSVGSSATYLHLHDQLGDFFLLLWRAHSSRQKGSKFHGSTNFMRRSIFLKPTEKAIRFCSKLEWSEYR